jgi:hypothetical protein
MPHNLSRSLARKEPARTSQDTHRLVQSQYRAPVFVLGPHLDPLGPLLGQPHEQRHAGRHTVQFGVVLTAALALFA